MTNQITEIDLTEFLCKQISSFYISELVHYADVILCVEDQKLPVHRFIMAARCEYFHKLFSSALNESNQNEFKIEASLEPFQIILQYFYTGKIALCNIKNIEILIQVIDLVEKYCLFDLKSYFENYFNQILSLDNICQLFEVARIYELKDLKIKSLDLIDRNAEKILNSESFIKFSKESLKEILTRDSFKDFSQICIFNVLNEWSKSGNRNIELIKWSMYQQVLTDITISPLLKWHFMSIDDLLIIKNLGNLTEKKIFEAIEKNMEDASRQKFDENFASILCNVRTFHGKMELLNGNSTLYDEKNGYTRHSITDDNGAGIIIDLRSIRIINHLRMLLWDRDDRSYSYFIEISTDQKNWKRIIDYSSYSCRTWQNLYFQPEPIRLIKIVGTHCSENEYFDVVTFEAYLRVNIPEIRDGFVVPKDNVALLKMGAIVVEGCQDNGGPINDDIENGYAYHINNRCILIRLNQPYHISSIRLLFHTNNRYKFKIQISLNMKDWETIVNQQEFVTSWQKFCFYSKPVVFIKFIGTESIDECYYLRHIECPAQD